MPWRSRNSAANSTTRCAATSKPAVSKICEPICECRPDELERIGGDDLGHGSFGIAASQAEAELLILVRGRDVFVGVRLDPDRYAHEHALRPSGGAGQCRQPVYFGERIHDDASDARRDGATQFVDR